MELAAFLVYLHVAEREKGLALGVFPIRIPVLS